MIIALVLALAAVVTVAVFCSVIDSVAVACAWIAILASLVLFTSLAYVWMADDESSSSEILAETKREQAESEARRRRNGELVRACEARGGKAAMGFGWKVICVKEIP